MKFIIEFNQKIFKIRSNIDKKIERLKKRATNVIDRFVIHGLWRSFLVIVGGNLCLEN